MKVVRSISTSVAQIVTVTVWCFLFSSSLWCNATENYDSSVTGSTREAPDRLAVEAASIARTLGDHQSKQRDVTTSSRSRSSVSSPVQRRGRGPSSLCDTNGARSEATYFMFLEVRCDYYGMSEMPTFESKDLDIV